MQLITTPEHISDLRKLKDAHADAIVLSTPFFSVRGSGEVEEAELREYREVSKALGMKLFIQVNRFFAEEEMEVVYKHLKLLKELEVDGIYFGDEGVLQLAIELSMEDLLIYNPDTLLTNASDVNFYLKQGLKRVCLSKEITLDEILDIASKCDASKLEVILHGRLSMMHSKRKLLTSYKEFVGLEHDVYKNRSLYMMEETRDVHMPIYEDAHGTHAFSGFTLCSFEEVEQMQQAGIGYGRIDGIFHDETYVEEVTALYDGILHQTIDATVAYQAFAQAHREDAISKGFLFSKTSKTK